jgi:thiamine biosynthesis protein ThiI
VTDRRDIVVRYGEIGIKGGNRSDFEKALAGNVKHALSGFERGPVERPRGRVVVRDIEKPRKALEVVTRLPGVISASVAKRTRPEMEALIETAFALMKDRVGEEETTFKVDTVRSDKRFPMKSMEVSARLGGEMIQRLPQLKARMTDPEVLLRVEIRAGEALLSAHHAPGPGGLPVGSTGKVVVLLSGGIDSPVAAYLSMKRGARCVFLNFHSYPFIPEASLDKIQALVRALGAYQGRSLLCVVPFTEIQVAIKKACPEELRTLLYRRMMMRLADRTAEETGALAVVTGECLGQVASQTLENIRCIGSASSLPVLRPLIGFDKTETVALAERIGTYPISIRPEPDCCTVFQPRKPRIRGRLEEMARAEEKLDVDALVEEAFARIDRIKL